MSLRKKAARQLKRIKELKLKNTRFKNYNFLTEKYRRLQENQEKKLLKSVYETTQEKKLWKQYEKIVKQSFKDENIHKKFRLNHVYQLNLDFQILFLYSKKDIGKTRQLGKELVNIRANDKNAQVVFIRNSKEEIEGFKRTMNDSIHWPTWTNGEYVWWKDDIKTYGIKGAKACGFMAYASGYGFQKWQGSEFDNVKFWMWDECNSVEGGLNEDIFYSVNVFLSSIIRDKKAVKGFMFGNLLDKNNVFLSRLGVGYKTKLKLFNVHEDRDKNKPVLSRLLYLNTGDLFSGIEKQEGLATMFLREDEEQSLLSNRPGMLATKSQYEEIDLKKYFPIFCFVFRKNVETVAGRTKKADFILYLYRIPNAPRFVCWIERFNPYGLKKGFKHICCYQKEIANNYEMTIIMEEEEFGESFIEPLGEIMDNGELWYGWNQSQDILEEVWAGWQGKFLSKEEKSI